MVSGRHWAPRCGEFATTQKQASLEPSRDFACRFVDSHGRGLFFASDGGSGGRGRDGSCG